MYKIGIIAYQGHCSTIALVKENKLIWASSEERFSRAKEDSSFPVLALRNCLAQANIQITDIETIYFAWNPWKSILGMALHNWRNLTWDFVFGWRDTGNSSRFKKFTKMLRLGSLIADEFSYSPKIEYVDHHLAHAKVASYQSGFNNCLCLVVDGSGESSTTSLYKFENGIFELLTEVYYPHSIGIFYATITQFLGFHPDQDEYKVMGLAPYGDNRHVESMRKLIYQSSKQMFELNFDYFCFYRKSNNLWQDSMKSLFGDPKTFTFQDKAHIAKAAQFVLQELLVNMVKQIKRQYGNDSICFSGGVFQNCALNKVIRESKVYESMYFSALCSDLGTAVGAPLIAEKLQSNNFTKSFETQFTGSQYSDQQIESTLINQGIKYRRANDITKEAAESIAAGLIVGWFQGAAELGPRALGNRSILADPRPSDMKDKVNARIKKREAFRPFSPSIIASEARKFFEVETKQDLRFMIETVSAKPGTKELVPSVIHIDNTARLQTVSEEDNRLYFQLLNKFNQITGVPMVLNTSFNVKDEPIVNSPEDALKTFKLANLDKLFIGNFVVEQSAVHSHD